LEEGASQREMSTDRDGSGLEEGKKRLIKLRDTGDDNKMVTVREEENEEKEHHKRRIALPCCHNHLLS
jgi:hypothetical protein